MSNNERSELLYPLRVLWIASAAIAVCAVAWLLSDRLVVTSAEYDQLENGMSYADAVDIIGFHGERVGVQGSTLFGFMEIYIWRNINGSGVQVVLAEGKLFTKTSRDLDSDLDRTPLAVLADLRLALPNLR